MIPLFLYLALIIALYVGKIMPTVAAQGFPMAAFSNAVVWIFFVLIYRSWATWAYQRSVDRLQPVLVKYRSLYGSTDNLKPDQDKDLIDSLELLGNLVAGDYSALLEFGVGKILDRFRKTSKTPEQHELEEQIAKGLQELAEQKSRFRMVLLMTATISVSGMLMSIT